MHPRAASVLTNGDPHRISTRVPKGFRDGPLVAQAHNDASLKGARVAPQGRGNARPGREETVNSRRGSRATDGGLPRDSRSTKLLREPAGDAQFWGIYGGRAPIQHAGGKVPGLAGKRVILVTGVSETRRRRLLRTASTPVTTRVRPFRSHASWPVRALSASAALVFWHASCGCEIVTVRQRGRTGMALKPDRCVASLRRRCATATTLTGRTAQGHSRSWGYHPRGSIACESLFFFHNTSS